MIGVDNVFECGVEWTCNRPMRIVHLHLTAIAVVTNVIADAVPVDVSETSGFYWLAFQAARKLRRWSTGCLFAAAPMLQTSQERCAVAKSKMKFATSLEWTLSPTCLLLWQKTLYSRPRTANFIEFHGSNEIPARGQCSLHVRITVSSAPYRSKTFSASAESDEVTLREAESFLLS